MKTFNYILQSLDYDFENFKKKDICFLDIETTGFSRKYNFIYLIGLAYYCTNSNCWKLVQFFSEHINDEIYILNNFNDFIKDFKVIISFNGENFDLPFIESRFKKYNIKSNLQKIKSFDIYKNLKKESQFLELENLKLKTVERSLGIFRHDKYTGKDCLNFYNAYRSTKDKELLNRILRHNYEDLFYLILIMRIFDVIKESKSIYIKIFQESIIIEIENITLSGDIFQIYCKTNINHENIVYYTDNYNLQWINNKLNIQLYFKKGMITPTNKCIFIDISKWPLKNNLKDLSQYNTPNNILLLKVDNKVVIDNIKLIIKEIVLSI